MSAAVLRHLVETSAGRVHIRSAGLDQDGPSVVFFHQSPSSSRMWIDVMGIVAAAGFRCAAPDMLDYGHSDKQSRQLSLAEHASLLVEAAQSLVGAPSMLVGHHTGAVFAAAAAHPALRSLVVVGYPLYTTWREKYERLGSRIGPDSFDDDGAEVADLWVRLNASLEASTSDEIRQNIYVDRLLAGPLWYTAYVALLAADLDAPLRTVAASATEISTVFARDDAISRLEPGVSAVTGTEPVWIEGGPWVTMEHPERVAAPILSAAEAR